MTQKMVDIPYANCRQNTDSCMHKRRKIFTGLIKLIFQTSSVHFTPSFSCMCMIMRTFALSVHSFSAAVYCFPHPSKSFWLRATRQDVISLNIVCVNLSERRSSDSNQSSVFKRAKCCVENIFVNKHGKLFSLSSQALLGFNGAKSINISLNCVFDTIIQFRIFCKGIREGLSCSGSSAYRRWRMWSLIRRPLSSDTATV